MAVVSEVSDSLLQPSSLIFSIFPLLKANKQRLLLQIDAEIRNRTMGYQYTTRETVSYLQAIHNIFSQQNGKTLKDENHIVQIKTIQDLRQVTEVDGIYTTRNLEKYRGFGCPTLKAFTNCLMGLGLIEYRDGAHRWVNPNPATVARTPSAAPQIDQA